MNKGFKCNNCNRSFKEEISLTQHKYAKHISQNILVDENLIGSFRKYQYRLKPGQKFVPFPNHLKGQSDDVIINYAKQKHYGLITHDKKMAEKARNIILPVYLV